MIPDFGLEKHTATSQNEINKQPKTKFQICSKYLHNNVYKTLYQVLGFFIYT